VNPICERELAGLESNHAFYVYALNRVAELVGLLAEFQEMEPLSNRIADGEEEYVPEGPPTSPLTRSYFNLWAFFDVTSSSSGETVGSIVVELGKAFGMASALIGAIELLQKSRMGLYRSKGKEGTVAILDDLFTGESRRVVSPAGYPGTTGELWFVRLLPPPFPDDPHHIAMTTSYVIVRPGSEDWLEYFERVLNGKRTGANYEWHMKHGPSPEYWPEYVFEAYRNHRKDVIWLEGLPDRAESRPHSRVNQRRGTVH